MKKGAKKEKTYWNIKESSIDQTLLQKIKKIEMTNRITTVILIICNCLFLMLLCIINLNKSASLVGAIIILVASLCALIIEIESAINLCKLKKEVKSMQQKAIESNQADENKNDRGDKWQIRQT